MRLRPAVCLFAASAALLLSTPVVAFELPGRRLQGLADTQVKRLAAAISERQKLNVHRCSSAPTGASRGQRFANTPYKSTFRLTQCDEGGPAHISEGQRFRTTHKTTFNHTRRAGHPHRSSDRP